MERSVDMCQAIREMLEDAKNEGREEVILCGIELLAETGMEKTKILKKLIQKFQISEEQAINYYNQFAAR